MECLLALTRGQHTGSKKQPDGVEVKMAKTEVPSKELLLCFIEVLICFVGNAELQGVLLGVDRSRVVCISNGKVVSRMVRDGKRRAGFPRQNNPLGGDIRMNGAGLLASLHVVLNAEQAKVGLGSVVCSEDERPK